MIHIRSLAEATDAAQVGGKAANLGLLIRAGFAVPGGFVIDASSVTDDGASEVLAAYTAMGRGTVAVRSSATAEDGATASMAGQFETILNVNGDAALLAAVRRCRDSATSDRVYAYAAEHGIDRSAIRMAIVVQKQVSADVAGVQFTAAPGDPFPRQMLIEASWGLGESVVSGKVHPDAVRVDFDDGRIASLTVADKQSEWTADGERPVCDERRLQPCLGALQIKKLWQLGRKIEQHFGRPQDIEWAFAGGELFVLQSRPITTAGDLAAVVEVVSMTRRQLADAIAAGRGPWVLHNLFETLPHPTPLTWSVVRRFMSAEGGYGRAYAEIGFEPAGEFLDKVAGRIYMDAARAPAMFAADLPYAYDAELLRREPDAAQQPPTLPRGSLLSRLRAGRRFDRAGHVLGTLAESSFDDIAAYVAEKRRVRLDELSGPELIERWQQHEAFVMGDVARREVLTGLRAGWALDQLRDFLAEHVWDQDAAALARLLSSGGPADASLSADAQLYAVGQGEWALEAWLDAHGHRGVGEMDLASPCWRHQPDAARAAAERLAAGESPVERHRRNARHVQQTAAAIRADFSAQDSAELTRRITQASLAVIAREVAKDRLMLGYDLLRDVAHAAGRRLGIGNDVFFLSREQLFGALQHDAAPADVIAAARRAHAAEARLTPPRFIGASEAKQFGERCAMVTTATATAISGGVATGPALVVQTPGEVGDIAPGYVLVCPSTDPSWTPAFTGAAALVLECGGALSHGAVVAREMGLPAVVLPEATRRFKTGDVLRVDGDAGYAALVNDPAAIDPLPTADDARLPPTMVPPPPGHRDRRVAVLRNWAAFSWTIVLAAFFLLPSAWVRWPVFAAFDFFLWPVVRRLDWPWTVTLIAMMTAVVTLLLQRHLTDNRRLLEAKRRATVLRKEARQWPASSVRQDAMLRAAAGVPGRVLGASLVPAGLLLGPMVAGFVWLGVRADPSNWNAAAGSAVRVVATVDGEWTWPVTLRAPESIVLDDTTPSRQALPPTRATLENLLVDAENPAAVVSLPNGATVDQLRTYLRSPIPPQGLTWVLRPPLNFDGSFAASVETQGEIIPIGVTVGHSRPPRPSIVAGSAAGPLRSVEVIYPRPAQARHFLRVAGVDVGWVGVYVAAYVLALTVIRRVARVA